MKVPFRVKADVPDPTRMCVFVVGDLPQLGSWSPKNAIALSKSHSDPSARPGSGSVWGATVEILDPEIKSVKYRYLIGSVRSSMTNDQLSTVFGSLSLDDRGGPVLDSVHTWEGNLLPRVLDFSVDSSDEKRWCSGAIATYGRYDGSTCVERGWLVDGQSEIQIRIHGNDPIHMYGRSPTSQYQIRCLPIDLSFKRSDPVEPSAKSFHHHDSGVSLSDLAGSLSSDDEPGRSSDTRVRSQRDTVPRHRPVTAGDIMVSSLSRCGASGTQPSYLSFPQHQPDAGISYRAGEFLSFRVRTRQPKDMAFRIVIGAVGGEGGKGGAEGSVFIMQRPARGGTGGGRVMHECIVSSQQEVIGTLTLDLLVIDPSPHAPSLCDGHLSPPAKRPLFIGHRGMGSSFSAGARLARVRENTLASFQEAFAHGVDMVEFDVVLSKDKVPVIYHDFVTLVHAAEAKTSEKSDADVGGKATPEDKTKVEKTKVKKQDAKQSAQRDTCDTVGVTSSPLLPVRVPVQELTLAELKALDVLLVAEWRHKQAAAQDAAVAAAAAEREKQRHDSGIGRDFDARRGLEAEQHFPTLRECFEGVDARCGFNVEVKHAMMLAAGGLDDDVTLAFELNEYVDAVLAVVFECAGDRTVVFSSFDPDVCLMLRLKQARYPVLLLTQGESGRPAYADMRACSVEAGVQYVMSEGMRGVDVCSRELVADPGVVRRAKERGVDVYCWGSENNSRENIKLLVESGVDAIILDKCDEFIDRV